MIHKCNPLNMWLNLYKNVAQRWEWRVIEEVSLGVINIISASEQSWSTQHAATLSAALLLEFRNEPTFYLDAAAQWRWRIVKEDDEITGASHRGWVHLAQCEYNAAFIAKSEWSIGE